MSDMTPAEFIEKMGGELMRDLSVDLGPDIHIYVAEAEPWMLRRTGRGTWGLGRLLKDSERPLFVGLTLRLLHDLIGAARGNVAKILSEQLHTCSDSDLFALAIGSSDPKLLRQMGDLKPIGDGSPWGKIQDEMATACTAGAVRLLVDEEIERRKRMKKN